MRQSPFPKRLRLRKIPKTLFLKILHLLKKPGKQHQPKAVYLPSLIPKVHPKAMRMPKRQPEQLQMIHHQSQKLQKTRIRDPKLTKKSQMKISRMKISQMRISLTKKNPIKKNPTKRDPAKISLMKRDPMTTKIRRMTNPMMTTGRSPGIPRSAEMLSGNSRRTRGSDAKPDIREGSASSSRHILSFSLSSQL